MIEYVNGNLLESDAEALVNTVNSVGVMGKGLALQFKRSFPLMHCQYQRACRKAMVQIGRMWVFDTEYKTIINFPTKKHWRDPSQLQWIQLGLYDLVLSVYIRGIESVAIPPLGCGNGGLDWDVVRPLIAKAFEPLPDVKVFVYEKS